MCANIVPCTPRPVATEERTGTQMGTPARAAKCLPGCFRHRVVAAEAGDLIRRITMGTAGR